MIDTGLRAATATGWAALLIVPDAAAWVPLWGLFLTGLLTLCTRILDKREAREIRAELRAERAAAAASRGAIADAVAENTAFTLANTRITLETSAKADAAYDVGAKALDAANNTNAKIESAVSAIAERGRQ